MLLNTSVPMIDLIWDSPIIWKSVKNSANLFIYLFVFSLNFRTFARGLGGSTRNQYKPSAVIMRDTDSAPYSIQASGTWFQYFDISRHRRDHFRDF